MEPGRSSGGRLVHGFELGKPATHVAASDAMQSVRPAPAHAPGARTCQ